MAVRKVRIWPDPALREVAKPVRQVDRAVQALVSDLFETMYKSNGVGLAATQIAEPHRVLVIDLDPTGKSKDDPGSHFRATATEGFGGQATCR